VILGSSAGALIGLQFVVISLVADDSPLVKDLERAGHAFATPTIVHFGSVLFLSAILNVPWRAATLAALVWGALGILGIVYTLIVVRRMRIQIAYAPDLEDWSFHILLPLASYAMLAGSAYEVCSNVSNALFGVAAAALMLLFVAIHNAWDAVTYHVFVKKLELAERHDDREIR